MKIADTSDSPELKNEKGIALLMVLWIITLLSVICAEFSWTMRSETVIVRNFKEAEQAYYTAEAGVNRAIIELIRSAKNLRIKKQVDEEDEEPEVRYWEPGGGPYEFKFGEGRCEVRIEDENNKISLNRMAFKSKKKNLKILLEKNTLLEGEELDTVVDSLIDWRDKNHNHGLNGAEDDYYESLDIPYECRDGEIPVLEELLMIKGIDEKIYYGDIGTPESKIKLTSEELELLLTGNPLPEIQEEETDDELDDESEKKNLGLVNIFSVTSSSKKRRLEIDVNTATLKQLLLLQGMDIATARDIINERKEAKFASRTDRLPQFRNYEVWKSSIKASRKFGFKVYTIKSKGFSPDGRTSRTIVCDLHLQSSSRCTVQSWKVVN